MPYANVPGRSAGDWFTMDPDHRSEHCSEDSFLVEAVFIAFAFGMGLLVRYVGLPPLVGFLGAGFAINLLRPTLALPEQTGEILGYVAHLGVLLLLFTVGLKLKLKSLVQPEVLGGSLLHFAFSLFVLAPALRFGLSLDWPTAALLAVALSFSSTVLAAKTLEGKRELKAFHGRVAIGILVVQDLIAIAAMTLAGGHAPSPWVLGLLALPLLRPVLHRLLDASGHDELLVLVGMLMALVLGGALFEAVGLSGELGALLVGVTLGGHPKAQELSNALWSLKEVLLVGFFLQIGMAGLPDLQALVFALVMALLLPLKGLLFFALLVRFRLRARNAFLASLSLTTYSEFGLIVALAMVPHWVVPLALTVAFSFLLAAPINRLAHPLFAHLERRLRRFERLEHHPDEQPVSFGEAQVLVMGMGRVGTAAYNALAAEGVPVVGLDSDPSRVARHRDEGRNVLYADAEDSCFWQGADFSRQRSIVLCMSDSEAHVIATRQLRRIGFTGLIVAHALYDDRARAIEEAGADRTYLTMNEAGVGLVKHLRQLEQAMQRSA